MAAGLQTIEYVRGDATAPLGEGVRIVAHVCNDIGAWGKGFVLALSRRWPEPEAEYRAWHAGQRLGTFALGAVQFVPVGTDIRVANMIAQHGIRRTASGPPIRYDALAVCLDRLVNGAVKLGASVHMPRIGCGLAGGEWSRIEPLILDRVCARGVSVTVYDFE